LIWPRVGDFDVQIQDISSLAFGALSTSTTLHPTPKELKLVEMVIRSCQRHPTNTALAQQAYQALRTAAIRWQNPDLWLRALAVAKMDIGIAALSYDGFVEGLQVFGLVPMQTL
jgi:hypothetical protein